MPEKYIVTSALPYVNGVKHLGNLVGSLLPADIYARFLRMKGKDVIAICGTDEHGTAAEVSALEEGLPIEQYSEKYYKIQRDIYERFRLSFDHFGRTSNRENHEITSRVFTRLWENGYIYDDDITQLWCLNCKRALADRYILGICPHCEYESARGDQCEKCTKLLNSTELLEPSCVVCGGSNLEVKTSRHLFLNLEKLQPRIKEWVLAQTHWPKTSSAIARSWIREGLRNRCITRDLEWGIPVPLDGFRDKVFYVWFDAPMGYISITMEWAKKKGQPDLWEKYWKDPDTILIQTMAKDNVPFHTVTWPATIMGANDGFILAHQIKGFQYLNYEGGKFSTSKKRGVFTDKALETLPSDYWRYYLISIAPERHDTDFKWSEFQSAVNSDLADTLGNFVHRTLTFIGRNFNTKVPSCGKLEEKDKEFLTSLETVTTEYTDLMDGYQFQQSLHRVIAFVRECNAYFQVKAPWKDIKTGNIEQASTTLNLCAQACRSLAILLTPFLPDTAERIYEGLGLGTKENIHKERIQTAGAPELNSGTVINRNPEPLFKKLDSDQVLGLEQEFSGLKAEPARPRTESISFNDFKRVDLQVAKIEQVDAVPGTKRLLEIKIDLGWEKRSIVAGLGEQYKPEDLIDVSVLVVANLEPKKIHGIESKGMLLAVEIPNEKDKYRLIILPGDIPPGSKLT